MNRRLADSSCCRPDSGRESGLSKGVGARLEVMANMVAEAGTV